MTALVKGVFVCPRCLIISEPQLHPSQEIQFSVLGLETNTFAYKTHWIHCCVN